MTSEEGRHVIVDASVLINFLHIGRMSLLSRRPGFQPLVPDEVVREVLLADHKADLLEAIKAGHLTSVSIDDPAVLETFAELRDTLGSGEAVCLAIAQHDAAISIASDEKGAFLRTAKERIGADRVLTTADLLLACIRVQLISVEDADAAKELLSRRRFRMPFASFQELLDGQPSRGPDDSR